MKVLTAFFDETGTHGLAPITCVGGYVFDVDGQRAFVDQWSKILEPLEHKGVRYFHAADCNTGNGVFSNLNSAQRRAFFGDLISLVRSTAKFGTAAAIEDEVFKQVMLRSKLQTFTGTKYTACAIRSLTFLGQWADEQQFDGLICYKFESGNESQHEADRMMKRISEVPDLSQRFRYGGHEFKPKDSLMPLQAADLLVWLWQRAFADNKHSHYLRELLSDHFKSGQQLSLQNRPTGLAVRD
jgi:hypothetical protein